MISLKPFTRTVEDGKDCTFQVKHQQYSIQHHPIGNNSMSLNTASVDQMSSIKGKSCPTRSNQQRSTSIHRSSLSDIACIYLTIFTLLACFISHGDALALNSQVPTTTLAPLLPREIAALQARADPSPSTSTTEGLAVASDVTGPTALPQPFDTSLGSNFTTPSCPQFFKTFLTDTNFRACYPFSLLLQTSVDFFSASKSYFWSTQVLDASCAANFQKCSAVMSNYNSKLKLAENCGTDYNAQNPLVVQAAVGLSTYDVMYKAGCLKDSKTGGYCYAQAITNVTPVADSFPYFIPMGLSLPSAPSCSECTQKTMQAFSDASGDSALLLKNTYEPAAKEVNAKCGTNWIPLKLKTSAASSSQTQSTTMVAAMAILVGLFLR